MVTCRLDCTTNATYIGFVWSENVENATELQLCIDPMNDGAKFVENTTCETIACNLIEDDSLMYGSCFYKTITFWSFVILMCLGTIGFNVSNCVSDATCFDVLGDKTMSYGAQRVWGTIGFGVTALLSGIFVHIYKVESAIETLAPALLIMLIFGGLDLISIKWLKLPKFTNEGETIATKVTELLRQKQIGIFLIFATLAGILDSFIIYYMFWYLEEVAERTGHMDSIKLIEGCVVAAECLGGEILFFSISGKILKRIGYVHCLSFCFFMYFIRLGLISLIPNPWWLILIEFFMQGSSYALCYTCIVAYASAISPPGTTATVQGLVAGMDDGAGFAIGSIIGGQMYKRFGGTLSFRIFAVGALVTGIAHILLRPANIDDAMHKDIQKRNETNGKLSDVEMSELQLLQEKNEIKAVIIAKP